MKVTIFGATGLLGKALMREWKNETEDVVVGLGSKDADVRGEQQVAMITERTRPDWIVLVAGYTDVDGCEINRDQAFDVNSRGVANVARAARQYGAKLLFISTDYVFDGTKTVPYEIDDLPAPRSVYGRSKADAETHLMQILSGVCVARTSWLFGVDGKCFPETILKLATSQRELEVVNDQRGCPTYTVDLARAIIQLCHRDATGIVHVTNRGDCTWFDFAREIVARAGLDTKVNATTSDRFVRPAERPKYSVLSPRSLEKYGIEMPEWRDALARYLVERKSKS